MAIDHLQQVIRMLDLRPMAHASPEAWSRHEAAIGGVELPADYKEFVDACGPCQVNGKVHIGHPATARWNLTEKVIGVREAFRRYDWADLPTAVLDGPGSLTPLASSDEGHQIFLWQSPPDAPGPAIVVHVGDGECVVHPMGFSEWMHRFLLGEHMLGEDSAYDYTAGLGTEDPFIEPLPL